MRISSKVSVYFCEIVNYFSNGLTTGDALVVKFESAKSTESELFMFLGDNTLLLPIIVASALCISFSISSLAEKYPADISDSYSVAPLSIFNLKCHI